MTFRIKFLKEELEEFNDAYERGDLVHAFDGLMDLVYVALGTAYMMNVPWAEAWPHVQNANMLKKRASHEGESTRGSSLDVVKPEGWVAPNMLIEIGVLKKQYEGKLLKFFEIQRKNGSIEQTQKEEGANG